MKTETSMRNFGRQEFAAAHRHGEGFLPEGAPGARTMKGRGPTLQRIAVLGNYGNRNLGDEATLHSVLQFVHQRCPWVEVCALSEFPAETRRRHGIAAVPSAVDAREGDETAEPTLPPRPPQREVSGWGGRLKARLKRVPVLFRALRAVVNTPRALRDAAAYLRFSSRSFVFLRGVDLLVVAGGGQLSDHFNGVWGFPLQLFSWCLLARCAGASVAVLQVGAGPIAGAASRVLFRWTLRLATFRSYRDERSRRLVEEIGVRDPGPVGPDLVFGWEPTLESPPEPVAPARRTVGLNVYPYRDWRYSPIYDPSAYAAYLERIVELTLWLLGQGYRVHLFPTQLRADIRVIADVLADLKNHLSAEMQERLEVASIAAVDDVASEIRRCHVIIATRFHAIVVAMLLGKPILALCNEPKMSDLMVDMGQAAYSLSLDTFDVRTTIARFLDLEANHGRVAAELADQAGRARLTLEGLLDPVFGPRVGSRGSVPTPMGGRGGVPVPRPGASPEPN
jgi:polysaccharide pyruvyl transferase WcaK-like protein